MRTQALLVLAAVTTLLAGACAPDSQVGFQRAALGAETMVTGTISLQTYPLTDDTDANADTDRAPLSGATVAVYGLSSDGDMPLLGEATSDADGHYSLNFVCVSNAIVTATPAAGGDVIGIVSMLDPDQPNCGLSQTDAVGLLIANNSVSDLPVLVPGG